MMIRIDMVTGEIETRGADTEACEPPLHREHLPDDRLQPALQEYGEQTAGNTPHDGLLAELDIESLIKPDC